MPAPARLLLSPLLKLITTYLGGEYIAPFTSATGKKVAKLKF